MYSLEETLRSNYNGAAARLSALLETGRRWSTGSAVPWDERPAPSSFFPSFSHDTLDTGGISTEDQKQLNLRARITRIHHMSGLDDREKSRMMQSVMTQTWRERSPLAQADGADGRESKTYYDSRLGILGCKHYRRGNKLQCSACGGWWTCRICHDELEDHILIRHETKNMQCMSCLLMQPAAQDCVGCGRRMAQYYCPKCKLWDDERGKHIYHCDDCGICRIGKGLGVDFFHCTTCNVCMSLALQNSHRCIERSTECNCPICGDYMFTSTMTVVFMQPCGHPIHQKCYYEHMKSSYKCPTCARSIVNMEPQFRMLDREIVRQPMPLLYATWRAEIVCNDCLERSGTDFHFLGLKCQRCNSYNTSQIRLIKGEDMAVDEQAIESEVEMETEAEAETESDTSDAESIKEEDMEDHDDRRGQSAIQAFWEWDI